MESHVVEWKAIRILIGNTLVKSGKTVFQIFLNIFIWKQTEDIQVVAIFNLIYLITHMVFFTLFAPIVKKWYRNFLHVFSLLGFTCVYLGVMYLGKNAINHLIIIPFAIWFFNSIYWINFHNTQFDLTTYGNRGHFEWIRKAMRTASMIIIPVFVGFLITWNFQWLGYEMAFGFGALLFFLAAMVGIVDIQVQSRWKFNLHWALKKCFWVVDVKRSLITYSFTSFSFSNSVIEVLIPIILFSYVSTEVEVWAFVSFFSVISIVATYLFGRFVRYEYYGKSILYLWFAYALALGWFVLFDRIEYLVLFSALITAVALLFSLPQKVMSDNVLHKLEGYKDMRSEYMVIREWFQAVWWILSFSVLYFLGSIERENIQLLFWAMVIAVFVTAFQLSKIDISTEKQ